MNAFEIQMHPHTVFLEAQLWCLLQISRDRVEKPKQLLSNSLQKNVLLECSSVGRAHEPLVPSLASHQLDIQKLAYNPSIWEGEAGGSDV